MQIPKLVFALVAVTGFGFAWFVVLPSYLLRLSVAWGWPHYRHLALSLAGSGMIAAGIAVGHKETSACKVSCDDSLTKQSFTRRAFGSLSGA
jgi:hypothetical protein